MRSPATYIVLSLCLLALSSSPAQGREQKRDPASGKVRILYFGDAFAGPSPYPIYANDPLTTITPIMASGFHYSSTVIQRHMRAYMPRTERRLIDEYDMIVISDANVQSFRPEYFTWFRNAVVDAGSGLVMIGGLLTFGAVPNYPGSWGETTVAEVLPVLCLPEMWEGDAGRLVVNTPEDPMVRSLPLGELGIFGVFYGCNIVGERQGVVPLAYYDVVSSPDRHPLLVFWEVGRGGAYAMTADWTPAGGTNFLRWAHYGDYALNLAIYVSGGKVPDDFTLVYEARRLMADFRSQRETLDSVIEFVSKFGANMAPAERILGDAEATRSLGNQHYLDGEMQQSIEHMRDALSTLSEASEKAYQLRDEALLWVYVTEWLVVASTGMICGFVLWTVMIRRRLYRQVGQTRLISTLD